MKSNSILIVVRQIVIGALIASLLAAAVVGAICWWGNMWSLNQIATGLQYAALLSIVIGGGAFATGGGDGSRPLSGEAAIDWHRSRMAWLDQGVSTLLVGLLAAGILFGASLIVFTIARVVLNGSRQRLPQRRQC